MSEEPVHRPRVLLLHNFLTPYRAPLFAELAKRLDLEVWILGDVRAIREWPTEAPEGAFRCRFLPHWDIPMGSRDYRALLNYTFPARLAQHLCDVVLCVGWDTPAAVYSAYWARAKRKPWVLWSGSTHGEPNWRRTLTRPLIRNLVAGASAWVAYGSRAQEYLESLGADSDRVFRAYNTVDTEQFAAASRITPEEEAELRRSLDVGDRKILFYCGQLIERKGLGDLLEGFARFSANRDDVVLVVAGSGNRESAYRAQAQSLGVSGKVVFTGFVARNALPKYYSIANLFALPSREEVWGLVINEALACGVPALTTSAVGAAPDLIQEGINGYAPPPADPEAIRAVLERHYGPGTDHAAMREAARKSIQPFTLARAADAVVEAVHCAFGRAAS